MPDTDTTAAGPTTSPDQTGTPAPPDGGETPPDPDGPGPAVTAAPDGDPGLPWRPDAAGLGTDVFAVLEGCAVEGAPIGLRRTGRADGLHLIAIGAEPDEELLSTIWFDHQSGAVTDTLPNPTHPHGNAALAGAWSRLVPVVAAYARLRRAPAYRVRQWEALDDLVHLRRPLPALLADLEAVDEMAGRHFMLDAAAVTAALDQWRTRALSDRELGTWARVVLRRTDVRWPRHDSDALGRALRTLAAAPMSPRGAREVRRALGAAPAPWYARPGFLALGGAIAYAATAVWLGPAPARVLEWGAMVLATAHLLALAQDARRFGTRAAYTAAGVEARWTCMAVLIVTACGLLA